MQTGLPAVTTILALTFEERRVLRLLATQTFEQVVQQTGR